MRRDLSAKLSTLSVLKRLPSVDRTVGDSCTHVLERPSLENVHKVTPALTCTAARVIKVYLPNKVAYDLSHSSIDVLGHFLDEVKLSSCASNRFPLDTGLRSFVVFFEVLVGYAVFGIRGVCRSMSSNFGGRRPVRNPEKGW